jgi:hypothetical protein
LYPRDKNRKHGTVPSKAGNGYFSFKGPDSKYLRLCEAQLGDKIGIYLKVKNIAIRKGYTHS